MLLLRQLAHFIKNPVIVAQRFYARKIVAAKNPDMKQVHQECLRYISPYAKIKVSSDIYVKIASVNPHDYPNGNAFIAELHGGPDKNTTATLNVQVSENEENVEVTLEKLVPTSNYHCQLFIPVKSSVNVQGKDGVSVKNIFGDELIVNAKRFINLRDVRAEKILINSEEEDISCMGTLLGKTTHVETKDKGNIILDKIQGNYIVCKTDAGNIATNSCYAESSVFETNCGNLDLKNVHKNTQVKVNKEGNINMSGLHGNIQLQSNDGNINIQIAELEGESNINSQSNNKESTCNINISDEIEKNTKIEAKVEDENSSIILNENMQHFEKYLADDKKKLNYNCDKNFNNKLNISSFNSIILAKLSWTELMRLQIEQQQQQPK